MPEVLVNYWAVSTSINGCAKETFMKKILFPLSMIAVLSMTVVALAKGAGGGTTTLDPAEEIHLKFMRAEEKLAHDVYYTLGLEFPELAVFSNIETSEQNHQDTMVEKLDQYGLPDPLVGNSIGTFDGDDYEGYFEAKFRALTELTSEDHDERLLEALKNGALIEELDMHDIKECPQIIVDTEGFDEDGCGLVYTDEKALITSYENLLEGSENHLRAFVRTIESLFPEEYPDGYIAQYLTQTEVDEILGR